MRRLQLFTKGITLKCDKVMQWMLIKLLATAAAKTPPLINRCLAQRSRRVINFEIGYTVL